VRAVDATTARCNFRRHPIPVSHSRSTEFPWALLCLGCTVLAFALGWLLAKR
jgi:hypothetical protein